MRCIALIFVCCILALTSADNGCPKVVQCLGNLNQQIGICQKMFPAPNATAATNNTCQVAVKQLETQLMQMENQREMTFMQCLTQRNSSALNIQEYFCRNVSQKQLIQPKNFTAVPVSSSSTTTAPPMQHGHEMNHNNMPNVQCAEQVMEIKSQCMDLFDCCSEIRMCHLNFKLSTNFTAKVQQEINIITKERQCANTTVVG